MRLVTLTYWLGALVAGLVPSEATRSDNDAAALALSYCSGHQHTAMLRDDHRVLCYDGMVGADLNWATFHNLENDGFFVVRSMGGNLLVAMAAANILLQKNATVVIYDYCLSACAAAFFIAAKETVVARDAIVAWHDLDWYGWRPRVNCAAWDARTWSALTHDEAARNEQLQVYCKYAKFAASFFKARQLDDRFMRWPQTRHTARTFDLVLREAVDKRSVFWMWNPKNHKDYFKLKITYLSYPDSQEKVNAALRRTRMPIRVIYDPEE